MFSNFGKGKDGKGKEKGKREREPRQVFQSQKEMDKAKGKGKTVGGAEAHIAAAAAKAAAANARGHQQQAAQVSIWERAGDAPSYIHGSFCLTRDDHLALEPLLTPLREAQSSNNELQEHLPGEVAEAAEENLLELGFLRPQIRMALGVVAPRLIREAEEREVPLTNLTIAERVLEWICSTSAETSLPSKLREPRDVTTVRRLQEDRNVVQQTKALLGGQMDAIAIARIEKLGFSRARAIQALAQAPANEFLPAVKSLLSQWLPLELPQGVDTDSAMPATPEELRDEVEAMRSIYGDDEVQSFGLGGREGLELLAALPSTENCEADRWTLAVVIPPVLPYPHVAPLLCPRHDRLRDANKPRLMEALGEVCRQALGTPMFFSLCEWLQENGDCFLVPVATALKDARGGTSPQAHISQRDLAVNRAVEASQAQADLQKAAEDAKAKRIEVLHAKLAEEGSRPKDKIAAEIRDTLESEQYDLAGYEDQQVQLLVQEAFSTPLACAAMVRITFVVGGGKTVRSKYNESLARTLGNSLQELGFVQDSTASCDLASAGSFKGQHDTQRNLKLVHVYPKIVGSQMHASSANSVKESVAQACARVARASWDDFVEEATLWLRDRDAKAKAEALLSYLQEVREELQDTDKTLREGQPVSETRRRRYDELGGPEDVAERVAWLSRGLEAKSSKVSYTGEAPQGTVLSFDAPSRLEQAARLAQPNTTDVPIDDDSTWLRRRVEQTKKESEKMITEFSAEKPLQKIRDSLPAFSLRQAIQQGVRDSQVVVIEGDTGCGKSTQIPQFVLEDWVSRGEGGAANIIMTQPRRISAIGVAERIANEMNTQIGDLVGYSIRLEAKRSARTKVLVCTTGLLLRRLESDQMLRGVTHVVVDECHERDLDTDFLLIVLRDLLPKRPNLRIILMSATINAQIFKDYFNGCASFCIPGRTFPVTSYYLEHALMHTNFVIEPDSEFCRKDVDPHMTRQEEEDLWAAYQKPEHLELVGESVPTHVLKQLHRVDPEKINFELVAQVVRHIHEKVDPPVAGRKPGAILVFVPGLAEIKKTLRFITEESSGGKGKAGKNQMSGKDGGSKGGLHGSTGPEVTRDGLWVLPLHSMISVAEQRLVFKPSPHGARKVVITTNIAETSITIDDVEYVVDCGRHKQTKYDPQNRVSMLVDCVETKANAKQRRGRAGRVKPGVCYHLVNVRKWRRMDDFEKPEMLRVPLDSLCLRVSLMGLGHPAKVLSKAITPPSDAAVLSSLQQLVELSAVELREKVISEQSAATEAGAAGWDRDEQQRLLKAKLKLTPLGNHLAQLPVDAGCGKLLVLGCIFGVPRDVCTVAAALSMKSPFAVSADGKGKGKGESQKRKLELVGDLESDQLLLVKLYDQWEQLGKRSQAARTWCRVNGLDAHTFETISELRKHLLGTLVEQGFASHEQAKGRPGAGQMPACLASLASATEEFDRRRFQLLRALLCAALWPNVTLRKDNGNLFARNTTSLSFHSSSVLALQTDQASQNASGEWNCPKCGFFNFASREECKSCWGPKPLPGASPKAKALRHRAFMFGEKVRTLATRQGDKPQTCCRDCCGVSLKALYLLGHRVQVDFLHGRMSLDGWIHCQAAPREASMLLGLRRMLQDVLTRRLSQKSGEPWLSPEDSEVVDVMTQLLVLDVE